MLKRIRSVAGRLFSPEPALATSQQRLYADERACAVALLSTGAVQAAYKTLNVDPEVIEDRLSNLRDGVTNPRADQVLNSGSPWHQHMARLTTPVELELCLLSGLLVFGSSELKAALTPPLGSPGDIPFLVAHRQPEAELRSAWPMADEQTGHVLLLNDPFTPMEIVVDALEASFGLSRDLAIMKMLDVHRAGAAWLESKTSASASETCTRLNAQWRVLGIPLYCEPQRNSLLGRGTSAASAPS